MAEHGAAAETPTEIIDTTPLHSGNLVVRPMRGLKGRPCSSIVRCRLFESITGPAPVDPRMNETAAGC